MAALDKIDANATPEHANTLDTARIIDAAVGLIGAPLLLILLVGVGALVVASLRQAIRFISMTRRS